MNDAEIEWLTRIHEVMQSDDRHAAAEACIRRMDYEIRVADQSRSHFEYQHGKALRLLETARRRNAYLAKLINDLGGKP